jgi:hypothetical protein
VCRSIDDMKQDWVGCVWQLRKIYFSVIVQTNVTYVKGKIKNSDKHYIYNKQTTVTKWEKLFCITLFFIYIFES